MTMECMVCGGDMDTLRMLRSEVSCYHCGHSVGTLEGPLGGPYTRFYPFGAGGAVSPPRSLRCGRCGGPTLAEQPNMVMIHPTVPFGRQRPGRKPRTALAQAV